MSEEQQPGTFAAAFAHLEYDSETERNFMGRHGAWITEQDNAADERSRQEDHDTNQQDFERGIVHERPAGDGDGIVTHRMPGPNRRNQSEGHLSRMIIISLAYRLTSNRWSIWKSSS